jgi:hypothetical protein
VIQKVVEKLRNVDFNMKSQKTLMQDVGTILYRKPVL